MLRQKKIFCISLQRTGTTSVGAFFSHFKYKVATHDFSLKNRWSMHWYEGNFEKIFNSKDFKKNQVFEDGPWYAPDFFKFLYHRFPNARFIFLHRPAEDWFQSLVNHSGGKSPGNTKIHCKYYRREDEFYELPQEQRITQNYHDNLLTLKNKKAHYIQVYQIYHQDVLSFFRDEKKDKLFYGDLYDSKIWQKMGAFFNIDVPINFKVHANKTSN